MAQWGVIFIMVSFDPLRWFHSLSQLPGSGELKHKAALPKEAHAKTLFIFKYNGKAQ